MKTVRNSAFETNSSSMHAIVVARAGYYNKEPIDVCMDASMDFSERTLIVRDSPDEKASYCFHLIIDHWNSKLVQGKWNSETCEIANITDKEVEHNKSVIAVYRKFISFMKKSLKKNWNINLTVKGVAVTCKKNGAEIERKPWASTGCYGHDVLKAILLDNMFATIDKISEPGADLSVLNNKSEHIGWCDFYDLAYFILDPNSVIIQNTDECDEKDRKKMQRLVMDYVKKNKGMCHVDWPLGG